MTTQPKFEVGKYYRRRDGSVRKLVVICAQDIFSLADDGGANYNGNGRYIGDHLQHDKDLIEEVFISTEPMQEPMSTPEAEHKRKRWEAAVAAMQSDLVHNGVPNESVTDVFLKSECREYFRMADAMLEVEKEGTK